MALLITAAAAVAARDGLGKSGGIVGHVPIARHVLSVAVGVTRLLLRLHVVVSLCLLVSRGVVGVIQLPTLTFTVTSFDQQLALLRNALHSAKDAEQLVVTRAREVTARTRQRFALLVTILSLCL